MKRYHLFGAALGSAALAFTGTALAAASATGFNQYTVNANGDISLGSQCSTANGCVVLINEPGLLQARVTDTAGNQFFQTINGETVATNGGPLALDANNHPLMFRNEAFVGVGSTNTGPTSATAPLANNNDGSYSVAALNYVDIGNETDATTGQSYVDTVIHHGNLPAFIADGAALTINQQNVVGSGTQTATENFQFQRASLGTADGFTSVGGAKMRIDQTGPVNGTGDGVTPDYFTYRAASGLYQQNSGTASPAGTPIAFSAGDYIQAVWMTSQVYNADGNGGGTGSNGVFEYGSFNNVTTATSDGTANDTTTYDGSGVTNVTWTAAGPGWWDGSAGLTASIGATTDAFPTDPNLALGVVP